MVRSLALSLGLWIGLAVPVARATPIYAIPLELFTGGEAVVDFNAIPNTQPITTQYAALGVAFSGGLVGLTNPGDLSAFPGGGGGAIASNWIYSIGVPQGLSFSVTFSSTMRQVGFYLETWPNQRATVELFSGATSLGSLVFRTQDNRVAEFTGIQAIDGFDRLVFTISTNTNGFYAIDDFRFEPDYEPIPEPVTSVLVGLGLAALGRHRRIG
jgi:hypothetical protein